MGRTTEEGVGKGKFKTNEKGKKNGNKLLQMWLKGGYENGKENRNKLYYVQI